VAKGILVSEATKVLSDFGELSPESVRFLSQHDHEIPVTPVAGRNEEPAMACFVIDASPSMKPYTADVIAGQHILLDALRKSAKCRKDALYIGQWLFSGSYTLLNPLEPLSREGLDKIVPLDVQNYRPQDGDGTALHATVYEVLQSMVANIAFALGQNIITTFSITIITDGENNRPGADPSEIKTLLEELRANRYLTNSIVIGIESPELPRAKILEIQQRLGFDATAFTGQSAKEIRRAFALASQSTGLL
jgi:hypothetical protein